MTQSVLSKISFQIHLWHTPRFVLLANTLRDLNQAINGLKFINQVLTMNATCHLAQHFEQHGAMPIVDDPLLGYAEVSDERFQCVARPYGVRGL